MFVVHDREELVHRQHLAQGIGRQELPGPLQRQHVAQGPVRVVGLHQVVDLRHGRLRVADLHALTPDVAVVKTGRQRR